MLSLICKILNHDKVNPLTYPNSEGLWPRRRNHYIRTIHNNLSNDEIEYLYDFYELDMPDCTGYSARDAKNYKLMFLKGHLGSRVMDPLLMIRGEELSNNEVNALIDRNLVLHDANANHRTGEFQVLRPLHAVGFTIPNTIAGLERLSSERKRALLGGFDIYPRLDADLLDRIFILFGLRHARRPR